MSESPKDAVMPQQEEMPFAVVQGQPQFNLPKDLYIPPDALEVFLDAFEGPLDLLLYLIRRQNLDILDIPIADITRQYMEYIELMTDMRLELAAEYLVMAAMLGKRHELAVIRGIDSSSHGLLKSGDILDDVIGWHHQQ